MEEKDGETRAGGEGLDRQKKDKTDNDIEGLQQSESEEPAKPIDWSALRISVARALRRPGGRHVGRGLEAHGPAAPQPRGYFSIEDVVQEAITELHTAASDGQPMPETQEEIEAVLVERARRRWRAWTKRDREQRTNLDLLGRTLSPEGMFDNICSRDEQAKFFAKLYDALGPEAQELLEVLLIEDIPFAKTAELAKRLVTTVPHVRNMKRRLGRHAKRIMTQMTQRPRTGGGNS